MPNSNRLALYRYWQFDNTRSNSIDLDMLQSEL